MSPAKIGAGFVAISALLLTFAIQRIPGDPPIVVPKAKELESKFDAAWSESFKTNTLNKADRDPVRVIDIKAEPQPIKTERVVTDAPAKVPPVIVQEDEEQSPPQRRRRTTEASDGEKSTCIRHHLRTVYRNGGKSWRCRK